MTATALQEGSEFTPVDAMRFREIMRNPISSVVIVATGEGENRAGCTVTAVCSLSDSPPSVLVCLNRQSSACHAVVENGRFSVNYLMDSQIEDADRLAGRSGVRGAEKFSPERWKTDPSGVPCLRDALAVLICDLAQVAEFGSHTIICGTICGAMSRSGVKPLLYGQGRYVAIGSPCIERP